MQEGPADGGGEALPGLVRGLENAFAKNAAQANPGGIDLLSLTDIAPPQRRVAVNAR
ncbi:MAG: hypothetical protein JWQ80_1072 [Massilia sp.]|nr:hypothetical protein [Massilia sp.]